MNRSDARWSKLQAKIEEYSAAKNYFGIGITYYEMAKVMKDDVAYCQQLSGLGYKFKLAASLERINAYKSNPAITGIEVSANKGACEQCSALNGKIHTVEQELETPTIPVKDCSAEYGCRCTYLPVTD